MKLLCSLLLALAPTAALAADPMPSAESVLHTAKAEAQAQHKNILLSFGASWCGNCRLYARFLEDPTIQPLISKAFVTTELITGERPGDPKHSNNPGGLELENSLGGKGAGWPYLAILSPDGKLLIDSFQPHGSNPHADNIGYPYSPAEVDWFVHMLQTTAPALTTADLNTIHTWLTAHGSHS